MNNKQNLSKTTVVFTDPNDIEEYKSICNGTHPDTLESQKRKELSEKWTKEHCKFTHTSDGIIIECAELNEEDIMKEVII